MDLDVADFSGVGWGSVAAGTGGPTLPIMKTFTAPGALNFNTVGAPAGVDILFQLTGPGGGGGAEHATANGGGGGGSGCFVAGVIPADLWALGGSMTLWAGGLHGAEPDDPGAAGHVLSLVLNGIAEVTTTQAGGGLATGGVGGAGATATFGSHIRVTTYIPGRAGATAVGTAGGAGGAAIVGGAGSGGNGNDVGGTNATSGGGTRLVFSW